MKKLLLFISILVSLPSFSQHHWLRRSVDMGEFFCYSMTALGDSIYASGTDVISGTRRPALYRSVNEGKDWTLTTQQDIANDTSVLWVLHHTGTKLFAGFFELKGDYKTKFKVTTDEGKTWSEISGIDTADVISSIVEFPDKTLLASGLVRYHNRSCFYKSTDGGISWQKITPLVAFPERCLHMNLIQNRLYISTIDTNDKYRVYFSDDTALNWIRTGTITFHSDYRVKCIASEDGVNLFALGGGNVELEIYYSNNGGISWEPYSYIETHATRDNPQAVIHHNGVFYASFRIPTEGYYSRIYASDYQLNTKELIGKSMKLYPNPASNSIRFEIPDSNPGSFSGEIITLQGQKVKTAGIIDQSLDVSDLAPGIYFLKVWDGRGIYLSKFIKE